MDYSAHHHYQGYDPSPQPQQFYNQPTEDYYSYAYSNPQHVNNQPFPYHVANVQPSQHEEQEPYPPGVTVPPPPQYDLNAYYQSIAPAAAYNVGPQQGGVDAGVEVAHQPIVQSSYNNNTGIISGVAPLVGAQTHLGSTPNFSAHPYRGHGERGRGRGRSPHKHGPPPAQDQAIVTQGGPHIQVAPLLHTPSFDPTLMLKSVGGQIKETSISSEVPFQPEQLQQGTVLPFSQDINEESKTVAVKVKVEKAKPLWCELCKAYCNSAEIFKKHLNGKRHLKNLSKTQIGVQTEQQTSAPELKPEIPFQPVQDSLPSQDNNEENKVSAEKQQVEESEPIGRGSKRKMRGGKVGRNTKPFGRSKRPVEPPQPKEVTIPLLCELCDVTCESQVVLQSHLVGKQHLLNAKRFLSENETLGQEVFQILKHAFKTLQAPSANASTSIIASQLQHHGLLAQPMETNFVEGISQPQLQAEGISNEGFLDSAEMGIVATEDKPVVTS
ncbi:hypothetical protein CASFOL_041213 [Castilleja foliolosa]|uniref:Matrin-type domain-containing protein n=1 Tax=Castilleja foliolosa TaxID=1961234 RepID=A0ABD3BDZ9_9LAMI